MKSMTYKASLLVGALLLGGCVSTETKTAKAPAADPKAEYQSLLAETQAAVDKAASVGGEWPRPT